MPEDRKSVSPDLHTILEVLGRANDSVIGTRAEVQNMRSGFESFKGEQTGRQDALRTEVVGRVGPLEIRVREIELAMARSSVKDTNVEVLDRRQREENSALEKRVRDAETKLAGSDGVALEKRVRELEGTLALTVGKISLWATLSSILLSAVLTVILRLVFPGR